MVAAAASAASVVAAREIAFGYRDRPVLENLDFDVPAGLTSLIGVNGAGKTTVMKMILGDLAPARGDLKVLGHSISDPSREFVRQIGWLPQSFGFSSNLTAHAFVSYLAWLRSMPRKEISDAANEALARVNMSNRAKSKMGSLSGGMLRRVGVAQAIVHKPRLILLDEPTAGLDPEQRIGLRELLIEIAGDASILMSTHLLEDVRLSSSYVIVLDRGSVRFSGTAKKLADQDEHGDVEQAFLSLLGRNGKATWE